MMSRKEEERRGIDRGKGKEFVEVFRKVSPEIVRNYLKRDDVASALLLASTNVEGILYERLADEIKNKLGVNIWHTIKKDRHIHKESLGFYHDWCRRLNLIKQYPNKLVKKLRKKRNKLAHNPNYFLRLQQDGEEKEKVREIVKETIEFMKKIE